MSDDDMRKWIEAVENYNREVFGTPGWKITAVRNTSGSGFTIGFIPPDDDDDEEDGDDEGDDSKK